ncbi:MAG TPA: hypothetical protein VEC06_06525 [Paucimonas sp.]|nr:hypothetical protein [Paucimonas sp.]
MSSQGLIVLVVLSVLYAAFTLPMMVQLYKYYEDVARATNRIDEYASVFADENGNNKFQCEQLKALRSGELDGSLSNELVSQGKSLARKLQQAKIAAVAIVLAVIAVEYLMK